MNETVLFNKSTLEMSMLKFLYKIFNILTGRDQKIFTYGPIMDQVISPSDIQIGKSVTEQLLRFDRLCFPDKPAHVFEMDTIGIRSRRKNLEKTHPLQILFGKKNLENGSPLQDCYMIRVGGLDLFVKKIQLSSWHHPAFATIGAHYSEEEMITAVSAHEVRHRWQYAAPGNQLITPWDCRPYPILSSFALDHLTVQGFWDDDLKLNIKEFDARMIESAMASIVRIRGHSLDEDHKIITSNAPEIEEILARVIAKRQPDLG